MIAKYRGRPVKIQQLEALLRRLPEHHPKRELITAELAKSLAGLRGEESLDYYLSYLPEQEFIIFQDLRLKNGLHFFQMDFLLLSASFLLIIEAKNISGTLFFDPLFHQMIRTTSAGEEAFPDPVLQVQNQKRLFTQWIQFHKLPAIPIETLVVMTNSQAVLKTHSDTKDYVKSVIRSPYLQAAIANFSKQHHTELYTPQHLRKLRKLLLQHHTSNEINILERFGLFENELLTGVHCPDCLNLQMEKRRGKWYCPRCLTQSKNAHLSALSDYSLLIRTSITNQQLRAFLHIQSPSAAAKLLQSTHFPHTGQTKKRAYQILP
ncbi:hypothetical protein JOC78_001435 [Bacillus ectoiniformans]|uniref:NERD domain-containing protein n=1 Tax=Bacillus ectoiniformans TaxID=1494429 RepID=UPI00195BC223|nr:NERD domain-containing protein [Bacillus ectoiniformans]MBM7648489.1 hypothetical protein [Bacillus ectoiniformans]